MPLSTEDSYILQARLRKLIDIIEAIKKEPLTVSQIAERFDISRSTAYRYGILLMQSAVGVDCNGDGAYFMPNFTPNPGDDLNEQDITTLKKLVRAMPRSIMRNALLKKLMSKAEALKSPWVDFNIKVSTFIEKFEKAIKRGFQVTLIGYHSAHSRKISDRVIEPVHFGENFKTVIAFDPGDKKNKVFTLERMNDVEVKRIRFKFKKLHRHLTTDVFGYTSEKQFVVKLRMTLPAFVNLRETYPAAEALVKKEREYYFLTVPINHYDGIAPFVLGHLNDVKILESKEFRDAMLERIGRHTL